MMFKYLNELDFYWQKPYNPDVGIPGVWMFSSTRHHHEQWLGLTIMSDPMYHTAWGIQKLLNEWKINAAGLYDPPNNVFSPQYPEFSLFVYQQAQKAEVQPDVVLYHAALDNMVAMCQLDLINHVWQMETDLGSSPEHRSVKVTMMVDKFQDAFS